MSTDKFKLGDKVRVVGYNSHWNGSTGIVVGKFESSGCVRVTPLTGRKSLTNEGGDYGFREQHLELVSEGWSDTKVDVNLEKRVKELEKAVRIARMAFHSYQLQHEAKETASGLAKARTNEALADLMEKALK